MLTITRRLGGLDLRWTDSEGNGLDSIRLSVEKMYQTDSRRRYHDTTGSRCSNILKWNLGEHHHR